jgi:DUF1365 family protein
VVTRAASRASEGIDQARWGDIVTPACYDVDIAHRRRDPIDYGFSQRSTTWLVDLDRVPSLPRGWRWLARFCSRDHFGDKQASLRENIDRFLDGRGVCRPAKVLMLANPRVLGYVFNPLTVFYCYDETGTVTHVLAEVRNTYGGRYCYLMPTDASGRAQTDKAFYVSPFYPVDGRYTMTLPPPAAELLVNVTLYRDGERPFAAVMTGQRRGEVATSLFAVLRTPLATRAVMFGIKRHGIRLYIKGLRPSPRPSPTDYLPSQSSPGEHTPGESRPSGNPLSPFDESGAI